MAIILSFPYFKSIFNELYACSLALFHLCVTALLRLLKPKLQNAESDEDSDKTPPPAPQESLVPPDLSQKPACSLSTMSYGACGTTMELAIKPTPVLSPVKSLGRKGSGSAKKATKARSIKSKYSFKRKRHSTKYSIPDFNDPHEHMPPAPSPESVETIHDRIKVKRRSALRPLLLIQDRTVDLRPFLLPEQMAQRTSLAMDHDCSPISSTPSLSLSASNVESGSSMSSYKFPFIARDSQEQNGTENLVEDSYLPIFGTKHGAVWSGLRGQACSNNSIV